jgi:EpsI family protein
MTIRRLIILQIVLVVGFGSVFLLPRQSHSQPAGVTMELPDFIDTWWGVPEQIGKAEREELAADTTFARRIYSNGRGDRILASIVLAGEDPDNSLHRPERCLPAQGWTVMDSKVITIKAPGLPNGELKVTRLHSQQKFPDSKGRLRTVYNLNYYWFVGVTDVTPSAIRRAVLDIRDRVAKGIDQRWAYVTVASNITEKTQKFGRSEQATDELIQGFIGKLYPTIVQPTAHQVAAVRSNGEVAAISRPSRSLDLDRHP